MKQHTTTIARPCARKAYIAPETLIAPALLSAAFLSGSTNHSGSLPSSSGSDKETEEVLAKPQAWPTYSAWEDEL